MPWPSQGRLFRSSWGPLAWPATRSSGRSGSVSCSALRIPPPWPGVYAIASDKAVGNCTNISTSTYVNPVAYDLRKNYRVVGITPTCDVTNPPSVGGFTADPQAVRVSLSIQKRLAFSGLFLPSVPTITATSTATIVPSGNYCVISLEDQAVTGINATGSTERQSRVRHDHQLDVDVGGGRYRIVGSDGKPDRGRRRNSRQHALGHGHGASAVHARPGRSVRGRAVPAPADCGNIRTERQAPASTMIRPSANLDRLGCFNDSSICKARSTLESGDLCRWTARLAHRPQHRSRSAARLHDHLTNQRPRLDRPDSIGEPNIEWRRNLDHRLRRDSGTYKGIMMYQDRRATGGQQPSRSTGNNSFEIRGCAIYFPRAELDVQRHVRDEHELPADRLQEGGLHRQQRHQQRLPRRLRRGCLPGQADKVGRMMASHISHRTSAAPRSSSSRWSLRSLPPC